jgi:hypothetical protein
MRMEALALYCPVNACELKVKVRLGREILIWACLHSALYTALDNENENENENGYQVWQIITIILLDPNFPLKLDMC